MTPILHASYWRSDPAAGGGKAALKTREEALNWAENVGFTRFQAPYAAAKALTLKTARKGAPVYPSEIREALEHTQPHIFLDPNQQKLFSEEAL